MYIYHVHPAQLPEVWPTVAPMLQKAIDLDTSNATIEQVEWMIRTAKQFLIVAHNNTEIVGAAVVEFIDYPRERIGHIDFMGGKGVANKEFFGLLTGWIKRNGAKKAQCWANGSLVRLYERIGMTPTHQVMRITL